ncbi:MAG TPA: PTS sugar transporter subunit IIB [bacterium]|nr:PTS sugar transporter subunit IIB [bacterium]
MMDIQLIRIDDRLIHGQVVVGWSKSLNIQRLVVVNDAIAKNAMQRTLMEMAVPSNLRVSFFTVEEAVAAAASPDTERALVLFSTPTDLLAYVEKGGSVRSVNVGGLHFTEGRRQVCKVVCVTAEDVEAFKKLRAKGIEMEIRAVPGDLKEPLEKYLPEIKA